MQQPFSAVASLIVLSLLTAAAAQNGAEPVAGGPSFDDPHLPLMRKAWEAHEQEVDPKQALAALYPSARECGECHKAIYWEWSTSQHAYASISPMFHKFEQTLNRLASGTVGAFCVRCHASVGTEMGEERDIQIYERSRVSLEGVTCITCHRVNENYMKANGARSILAGKAKMGPIFGPTHGASDPSTFDQSMQDALLKAEDVHQRPTENPQLSSSEFCMSCHQVAVYPGIKLEVVWDQYKGSPAMKRGKTCQDCHMGKVIGDKVGEGVANYMQAPIMESLGERVKPDAKHTDHSFVGPGYSIAHPGLFPHSLPGDTTEFSVAQWLAYDWRAWGKDDFEQQLADGKVDPPPKFVSDPPPGQGTPEQQAMAYDWSKKEDRDRAREIVKFNEQRMVERSKKRQALMESGSHLDGPFFDSPRKAGRELAFHYEVHNISDGHNFPSGSLGAQPEIWLNVALLKEDGQGGWTNIWESGFTDSHGDMADIHSQDVVAGLIEPDHQLFNLQTKFLTTNLKGTDREMYLPVPFDGDQLPYIRPAGVPSTVLNHPPFIRMEQRSIPPLSSRTAKYSVPGELVATAGTYRLAVRLCSRAEPMYFMEVVGATPEMRRAMNEMMIDIHPYTVEFTVE